jgi:hypothetical protein
VKSLTSPEGGQWDERGKTGRRRKVERREKAYNALVVALCTFQNKPSVKTVRLSAFPELFFYQTKVVEGREEIISRLISLLRRNDCAQTLPPPPSRALARFPVDSSLRRRCRLGRLRRRCYLPGVWKFLRRSGDADGVDSVDDGGFSGPISLPPPFPSSAFLFSRLPSTWRVKCLF